ncbi:MAG TPA: arylesterase [Bacteroidetes bacterium]|nr:arylesterase [Bacteroidota bacterium]
MMLPGIAFAQSASNGSAANEKTILFLGDSITAGYGLDETQAFPALIESKIQEKGYKYRVINAGLSGDTSSGGLRRIDWLLRSQIDILVLELGANDGLRGIDLAVTKQNLQKIIDQAKAKNPKLKVVIAGMQVPPNLGDAYTKQFREIFPALAKSNNATLIPFLLEGVAGNSSLNLPDGIHPNVSGHTILANNVWNVLSGIL